MRQALSVALLSLAAVLAGGCPWSAQSSGPDEPIAAPVDDDPDRQQPVVEPASGAPPSASGPRAASGPPATPTGAHTGDAPEISRSVGSEGGLVVFWPRVIPRTGEPAIRTLAAELQRRLVSIANRAAKGRQLDVRPEPERVCPRDGCAAPTVGVLLVHHGGGCTALALVSGAGKADQRIVPWAGVVDLQRKTIAFREHPESEVTVRDAVPCNKLIASLDKQRDQVARALSDVVGR